MSHFKNVQNFDKVIAVCAGLGGNYNPGKQNLQIESLVALMNNAHDALDAIKVARTNYEFATNHREVAFEGLSRLTGRIVSELKSSGVLSQTVDDARSIQRKLTGFRASRDPVQATAVSEETVTRKPTARGLDYGTQAENFSKLLQTLRTESLYQPPIPDLKMETLEAKLGDLIAKNADVVRTAVELKKARQHRNDVLYYQSGSAHETLNAVKQKVKAAFGPGSNEFRSVIVDFIKPSNL